MKSRRNISLTPIVDIHKSLQNVEQFVKTSLNVSKIVFRSILGNSQEAEKDLTLFSFPSLKFQSLPIVEMKIVNFRPCNKTNLEMIQIQNGTNSKDFMENLQSKCKDLNAAHVLGVENERGLFSSKFFDQYLINLSEVSNFAVNDSGMFINKNDGSSVEISKQIFL